MYSVNTLSNSSSLLQNVYTKPANSGSFKEYSEALAENIYAPTAGSRYSAQTGIVTPENFYDVIADKAPSIPSKDDFKDMYVTSAAHKYFYDNKFKNVSGSGLSSILIKSAGMAIEEGCMPVPIEAGELPQFMDTVQSALKNGSSLADILKQKYDEHISKYGAEGHLNSFADWFAIDPSTGEVMGAIPISRTYHGDSYDEQLSDIEAVMELSDDLASFLKYALSSEDTEDSKKVKELLSFIKNKQAYANYDRFLAEGEETAVDAVLQRLIDAGVLKDEEEEAVDGLMEAIRVHQKELKENKINIEESEKAVAEIREMIDSRSKA